MTRFIIGLLISISITFSIASARILNVPEDYETIQAGIVATEAGDTVLVQPGRYDENLEIRRRDLVLASLVLTTGDPAYIDSTIIDGGARDETVVLVVGCPDSTTAITGFTITNGNVGGVGIWNSNIQLSWLHVTGNRGLDYGDSDYDDIGAGINCTDDGENGRSRITISNCRIDNNICVAGGFAGGSSGGIKSSSCDIRFINVEIDHNEGGRSGGALFLNDSENILKNVSIHENVSHDSGGGIRVNCGVHLIGENLQIFGNSASSAGGCFAEGDGRFSLNHSSIFQNSSENSAGGIALVGNQLQVFTNCVIADNHAPSLPSALCQSHQGVNFRNSIIVSSSAEHIRVASGENSFAYCLISGGRNAVVGDQVNWQGGNFDADPLFLDPDNGDYSLSPDSPCRDAGDPFTQLDPDGTISDVGSYFYDQRVDPPVITEYSPEASTLHVNAGDSISFNVTAEDAEGDLILYLWRINGDTLSFEPTLFVTVQDTELVVECVVSDGESANCKSWLVKSGLPFNVESSPLLQASDYSILTAYPNPFNSSTTISYSLPRPGRYAIDVIDIQGRLVTRLSDGWMEAGSYREIWDGSQVVSGQYILKLAGANSTFTTPVSIIK